MNENAQSRASEPGAPCPSDAWLHELNDGELYLLQCICRARVEELDPDTEALALVRRIADEIARRRKAGV